MTPRARLQAYLAHPDPATAMANTVALVVGWNTPFYPLYVIAIAGRAVAAPAMLTAASTPFFLAIPALARRSPRSARFALPAVGSLNTLWCIKLLGTGCNLDLFFLPCVLLAALLYRPGERILFLSAVALALGASALPNGLFGTPVILVPDAALHGLATLNEWSVLLLCVVLAWQFAALARSLAGRSRA